MQDTARKRQKNNSITSRPLKVQPETPQAHARLLYLASFLCGAAVMVLEMTGSRLMAPYMGTSIIVWTSLIGIIMASLSAGYWLGGRIADRCPTVRLLSRIILAGAVSTAVMALGANALLAHLTYAAPNIYAASVLAALCLFAAPSVLLGMVSPFIVRLAMRNVQSAGSIVGRFSALSSAGSIVGTFLGGFILISYLPSGTILMCVAAVLALISALVLGFKGVTTALIVCGFLLSGAVLTHAYGMPNCPAGIHIDSLYNHIVVTDTHSYTGRPLRLMQTDPTGAQSVMFRDSPDELASDYTRFYDLAFHYNKNTQRVLMLGGGAYCVPRHLIRTRPHVSIDVVELDPAITKTAKKYFYLGDNPCLSIFHEDARVFLNMRSAEGTTSYDAIFSDVFGSCYTIPFQMTTVESMRKAYDLLAPEGVFIINTIASVDGKNSGIMHGIHAALSEVFPIVKIFPATYREDTHVVQNIMLIALKNSKAAVFPPSKNKETNRLLSHEIQTEFKSRVPAFTDAFAPVEKHFF